jgi:hypothetical protein
MKIKYFFGVLVLALILACNSQQSNKAMVDDLEKIAIRNNVKENPFGSEARLAFLDSITISDVSFSREMMSMRYDKGNALLEVGREKEAVLQFKQLLGMFSPDNRVYTTILRQYALALLRQGERDNCVMSHSTESCVMPIQGMGVHHNQCGSSRAIEAYESLLQLEPDDLGSQWLLNIAYMTLGQYPNSVPRQWLIPGLDKDTSGIAIKPFMDVAPKLRLDTRNKAGGTVVDDFNNDGFLDLVNSDWGLDGSMHFFKNNGIGGYVDMSVASGLSAFKGGLNIVQADYNNDGFLDILVLRGAWMPREFGKQPNSLLRNNGDDTFTDVTVESGLLSYHPTQAAVWRDFNNDGWLDIFIGNETANIEDYHRSELFISDQKGGFTNVAAIAGCDVLGFIKGVTAADYNNDGLHDIFISTVDGRRLLLKNKGIDNGVPHFEDVTKVARLDDVHVRTFPTWFWDYNNDGWPDIFVSGYQPAKTMAYTAAAEALGRPDSTAGKLYLYRNNHDGTFTNVSKEVGLNTSVFSMGANFGDIDNDGYLDMYLGTGNPDYTSLTPNKLFKNVDGKKFVDVTTVARVGNLQKGHGVSLSDMDNDGDQDIFIEVGGAFKGDAYNNSLYLNPGQNNNNWIYLSLKGDKSNRSAIGTRIKISFKDNGVLRTVYRDVNSGGSFGSSTLRREIGIGQATVVDEITISWAGSNKVQTFKDIAANQCISIVEGQAGITKVKMKALDFSLDPLNALPCSPNIDSN